MKQVVLNIKNSKYDFFMELLNSFDFVQVAHEEGDSAEEIKANLKKAFEDLQCNKKGQLKTTTAKDFLDEL